MALVTQKYSDFSMVFEPHPVTGDILKLKNEDAVKRSIRNIVLTGFYEMPFMPNFGSGVKQQLFENITVATRHQLISNIEDAIRNNEKRAKLLNVGLKLNNDRNGFDVTIEFEVIGIDIPVNINLFIERVR